MTQAIEKVGEQASFSGLGVIQLGTALAGQRGFADVYADGATGIPVSAEEMDADGLRGFPVAWELVSCTYDAGANTLTRDAVSASSNGNSPVNFGSGLKRVFVYLPVADVGDLTGAVRYDVAQSLSAGEQQRARTSINAIEYTQAAGLVSAGDKTVLKQVQVKPECKVASVGNISNFYVGTIDGISLSEGDRAFLWLQTDATQNGTYRMGNGQLLRSPTTGGSIDEWLPGATVPIKLGTYAGRTFRLTNTDDNITVGSTALNFELVPAAGAGGITAGDLAGGTLPASLTTLATSGVATLGGLTVSSPTYPLYSIAYEADSASLTCIYNTQPRAQYSIYGINLVNYAVLTWSSTYYNHTVDRDLQVARNGLNRMGLGSNGAWNDAALELGAVRKKPYTVGTLPVAPSAYDQCLVVDALAPAIGSAVVGGGGAAANVIWISPNWMVI